MLFILHLSCKPKDKKTGASSIESQIAVLTDKINEAPSDASKHIDRAEYYRFHKGYDEAIADYRKAIELDNQNPDYYFDLADTHIDYLDVHGARLTMDAVVENFPYSVEARLKMVRLLVILKEYDEVPEHLSRAKVMDPYNAQVEYTRGMYFLDQGGPDAAKKAFQASVELDDQLIDGWLALGEIASDQNEPIALTYFNNALLIEPKNIRALHAKAYFLQNTDNIDSAIEIYQQINAIDSMYELAYFNQALLHMERDELIIADDLLKRCNDIKPKMADAYFYRGIVQEKQGNIEDALHYYKETLVADPNYTRAAEAVKELSEKE